MTFNSGTTPSVCECPPTYEVLGNYSNLSWHCDNCGLSNFASGIFDCYITPSENSFSDLSSSGVSSILSTGPPISCSSPVASLKKKPVTPSFRSMKILNVNFQSVKNKKEEIGHIIDSVNLVDVPITYRMPISSVRGHGTCYLVPFARTQIYQNSFFPDTIRLWNRLTQTIVSCSSVDSFKEEVQSISLK
ncbi:hypothetical protein DPMN_144577 [Dreissena polymorpha]|uniref:Uncharacterized protein n=1 Tax=Dreissena polymorpha TaxID=45954 RepID=A0A9D4JL31_DREPO|nr:hypothetical protein DPMN_144577 [Dreissena polymorpha]